MAAQGHPGWAGYSKVTTRGHRAPHTGPAQARRRHPCTSRPSHRAPDRRVSGVRYLSPNCRPSDYHQARGNRPQHPPRGRPTAKGASGCSTRVKPAVSASRVHIAPRPAQLALLLKLPPQRRQESSKWCLIQEKSEECDTRHLTGHLTALPHARWGLSSQPQQPQGRRRPRRWPPQGTSDEREARSVAGAQLHGCGTASRSTLTTTLYCPVLLYSPVRLQSLTTK